MAVSSTETDLQPPRLYRSVSGRMVGGVAQGLAGHLGLRPMVVRLTFLILSVFGGFGLLLYAAYWAVVPQLPGDQPTKVTSKLADRGSVISAGVVIVGVIFLLRGTPFLGDSVMILPVLLAGGGLALVWRQADEAQRSRWLKVSTLLAFNTGEDRRDRLNALARLGGGAVLVVAGVASFLALSGNLTAARDGLVAALAIVAGVALITGPWWWKLLTDLNAERRERIRSQERADMAAHLHDSVLQTLALIQRHAGQPREVTRLARGQERELRAWLYKPAGQTDTRFAAALEGASADVEDSYAVQVETVVVGDAELDDDLAAVVAATREALVNAAKHAGVVSVSLYAEIEPERVSVFIRDRGAGFDPDLVAADRHGIAGSIMARMERHGGTGAVRSTPGAGTEVELTMERTR